MPRACTAAALAAALLAACTPQGEPSRESSGQDRKAQTAPGSPEAATVADVHAELIIPGSDALFAAEAEPPVGDAGWREIIAAAHKVIEGAHLLQDPARARDSGDWMRIAKAVEENAAKSVAAAEAKDPDALLLADGDFLVHCEDCHKIYRDAGGGMMASPDR